jgi:hypothetical protein
MKCTLVAGGLLFAAPALADDACESLKLQQALALEPQIDCPSPAKPIESKKRWTVIDFATGRCEPAHLPSSPAQAQTMLRSHEILSTTDVEKNDDGSVKSVIVSFAIKGQNSEMLWFTRAADCEEVRKDMITDGRLTDKSELE